MISSPRWWKRRNLRKWSPNRNQWKRRRKSQRLRQNPKKKRKVGLTTQQTPPPLKTAKKVRMLSLLHTDLEWLVLSFQNIFLCRYLCNIDVQSTITKCSKHQIVEQTTPTVSTQICSLRNTCQKLQWSSHMRKLSQNSLSRISLTFLSLAACHFLLPCWFM